MSKMFEITQIGTKPTQIGVESLSPVLQVIVKFADSVTKNAKGNINKQGIGASDNLSASIVPLPIVVDGNNYTLEIEWADYGKYVDQGLIGTESGDRAQGSPFQIGRNAPFAKRANIRKWITDKPINPGGRRGQRLPTRESLSYAITKSVNRKGTKRTLFFSDALTPAMQKALIEDVAEALGKTISISMKL
jgi:hypothetical protein